MKNILILLRMAKHDEEILRLKRKTQMQAAQTMTQIQATNRKIERTQTYFLAKGAGILR
jgi:hypothetical protein